MLTFATNWTLCSGASTPLLWSSGAIARLTFERQLQSEDPRSRLKIEQGEEGQRGLQGPVVSRKLRSDVAPSTQAAVRVQGRFKETS